MRYEIEVKQYRTDVVEVGGYVDIEAETEEEARRKYMLLSDAEIDEQARDVENVHTLSYYTTPWQPDLWKDGTIYMIADDDED